MPPAAPAAEVRPLQAPLRNPDTKCYLIATLQLLIGVGVFDDALREDDSDEKSSSSSNQIVTPLFESLKQLIVQSRRAAAAPGRVKPQTITNFLQTCLRLDVPGVHRSGQWDAVEALTGLCTRARTAAELGDPLAVALVEALEHRQFKTVRCMLPGCERLRTLKTETFMDCLLALPDASEQTDLQTLLNSYQSTMHYVHDFKCSNQHPKALCEQYHHVQSLPSNLLLILGRNTGDPRRRYAHLRRVACCRALTHLHCARLSVKLHTRVSLPLTLTLLVSDGTHRSDGAAPSAQAGSNRSGASAFTLF